MLKRKINLKKNNQNIFKDKAFIEALIRDQLSKELRSALKKQSIYIAFSVALIIGGIIATIIYSIGMPTDVFLFFVSMIYSCFVSSKTLIMPGACFAPPAYSKITGAQIRYTIAIFEFSCFVIFDYLYGKALLKTDSTTFIDTIIPIVPILFVLSGQYFRLLADKQYSRIQNIHSIAENDVDKLYSELESENNED